MALFRNTAGWSKWVVVIGGIGVGFAPPEARAVEIARDGEAAAVIVVPQAATETERFAAEELSHYLKETTTP